MAPAELDSASDEETIGNATEFNPRGKRSVYSDD